MELILFIAVDGNILEFKYLNSTEGDNKTDANMQIFSIFLESNLPNRRHRNNSMKKSVQFLEAANAWLVTIPGVAGLRRGFSTLITS
jgi:hypothetical protein